ncbi:IS5 family transposase [Halobacterium sp. GSL-19]|uniref:IS5 family transposase n=1 Tax=Halobacterium sp. GSL-19 TaxID=2812551 RepID=UPI0019630A25|nr:IS5 family transposase [Halobacterium sp. GSL-19]QRY22490.1 IS5 family transposase [Halobacterium sp. GSL-19]
MPSRLSRFTDRLVTLAKRAVSGDPSPPVKKGDGGYADWVIVVIHGLREYLDLPYRRLLDVLHEMKGIVKKLDLEPSDLPDFTTVCVRKQQLPMAVWRTPLRLSADLHDTGDVQAIDATGFDRHSASRHYADRADYTFKSVKTTALVDCETSTVLDIHCSMKQPHDTHVGRQVLTRNLNQLQTITADKGYDWDDLREELREGDVRPVIKPREFYPLDLAHNARHDDDIYHRRSVVEAVFFALKQRYGDTLRARTWFGQFRELVLKATVRNVELAL